MTLGRTFILSAALLIASAAEAANFEIEAEDIFFSIDFLTIRVGDSVTWTNAGGFHNVVADDGSFRCAVGCDGEGGDGDASTASWSFTRTFEEAGTIDYHCEPHFDDGMLGTIVVEELIDGGALEFTSFSFSEPENGGNAVVSVERVDRFDGAVSVQLTTQNGTATAGSDYAKTTTTLSWPDGDSAAKMATVTILDDSVEEGDETVKLNLSSPTGGARLGSPASATLTIVEDDLGSTSFVRFTSAEFSVGEGEDLALAVVARTGSSQGAISVDYATTAGTAGAGADYTEVAGTLSWGNGDTAFKGFDIPLLDDAEGEIPETLWLELDNPTGDTVLVEPSVATLRIDDNDGGAPCEDGDESACLIGRFLVIIDYETATESGRARATKLTESAAAFEFFEVGNTEIVIKMVDACGFSSGNPLRNFWVFIAGLTDVRAEITIVDLQAGTLRQFFNQLKQPFFTPAPDSPHGKSNPAGAIQATTEDLGAFPTCDA